VELMTMTKRMSNRAIALITAVIGLGAVIVGMNVAQSVRWTGRDVAAFLAIAAVTTVGERFTWKFRFGEQTKNVTLTESAYAVALLVGIGSGSLVLGTVAGVLAANLLNRNAAHKTAFNMGSFALSVTAAIAVFHAVAPAGQYLAIVPAMAAYFAVNSGTVVGVIAAVEGRSFASVFSPIAGVELAQAAGNAAAGVLIVTAPAVVPVVAVLAAGLYLRRNATHRTVGAFA